MSSLFEYRPSLEYALQSINIIDNLEREVSGSTRPYTESSTTSVITKVSEVKEILSESLKNIDSRLQNITCPINVGNLDDLLKDQLSNLHDASKLLNDGIITYPLYKEIKGDPLYAQVEDAWDEYHAGMNGSIEAELLPYVEDIDALLENILQLVSDAILYDEDPETRSDATKLRESELLEVEKYLNLMDQITEADNAVDTDRSVTLRKQFDLVENGLNYRKNFNIILNDVLSRLSNLAKNIYDGTTVDFGVQQYNALKDQLDVITKNVGITNLSLRAIIYSAFMTQYGSTMDLKRNYKNLLSKTASQKATKRAVKDARLYKDVAVPSIVELTYADEALPMKAAGNTIVTGLDKLTKSYQSSVLGMKNSLESNIRVASSLVSKVYEKYTTRTLYKVVGK